MPPSDFVQDLFQKVYIIPLLFRIRTPQTPVKPNIQRLHNAQKYLYAKDKLHALICVERDRSHGKHLYISNSKTDKETREASLPKDHTGSLAYSKSTTVSYGTSNLHSSSNHFKRI